MYDTYKQLIKELNKDIIWNENQLVTYRQLFRKYKYNDELRQNLADIIAYFDQDIRELSRWKRRCMSTLARQKV